MTNSSPDSTNSEPSTELTCRECGDFRFYCEQCFYSYCYTCPSPCKCGLHPAFRPSDGLRRVTEIYDDCVF
jgi:hypothetical protein